MWDYDPRDASDCLDEGSYNATLRSIEEESTKKGGKPMLHIVWNVKRSGKDWKVDDYIVNPTTVYKLKAIAKAWHRADEFDDRRFDMAEHIGKPILLKLSKEEGTNGYRDSNKVLSYEETSGEPEEPAPTGKPAEEEIPF